mmetsp:Transcript_930/g.1713  ORF Transcript_930/g.1713 Transcript_930/m.1713 type:complete len:184 (-) Transcript_930:3-554(-)
MAYGRRRTIDGVSDFVKDKRKKILIQYKKSTKVGKAFLLTNVVFIIFLFEYSLVLGWICDNGALCEVRLGRNGVFAVAFATFGFSAVLQQNVFDLTSWLAMNGMFIGTMINHFLTEADKANASEIVNIVLAVALWSTGTGLGVSLLRPIGKHSTLAFYVVGSDVALRKLLNQFLLYQVQSCLF